MWENRGIHVLKHEAMQYYIVDYCTFLWE